jgi:hypothetical protein
MRGPEFENSGPLKRLPQLLDIRERSSPLYLRRFASVGRAASLAFAGVLAFATVVAGFATPLTLTIVLAFARMFALFRISHCLKGDSGIARSTCGIGAHGHRPS